MAALHRVISLAYKKLGTDVTAAQLRELSREDVESGLTFGGFAVLQCPLKSESEPALRMLKESSHQLVMITGDAPLTACHAAGRVHIVDRPVLILTHRCAKPSLLPCSSLIRLFLAYAQQAGYLHHLMQAKGYLVCSFGASLVTRLFIWQAAERDVQAGA